MTSFLAIAHCILSSSLLIQTMVTALAVSKNAVSLQNPHPEHSPAEIFHELSKDCEKYGIDSFDVYGDFDTKEDSSFLRRFEAELAEEMGMEDAVFMPSGVMAQSIALLIHSADINDKRSHVFACHHTSHLLLHEQEAYRELLHMEPIVISTQDRSILRGDGLPSVAPMMFEDVTKAFERVSEKERLTTLILELPHRELGGKLTPWDDILKIRDACQQREIKFHCDGARIFEATTGYDKTLKELAAPFDSVYVSFYKGLGGISGAMLLGSNDLCEQARIWLRRFGGNLYTLLPYALSGYSGYQRNWKLNEENILSFQQKKNKLVKLVSLLMTDKSIQRVVCFDPATPQTNMIHGYLRITGDECTQVCDLVEKECGIRVLSRLRDLPEEDSAYQAGFRSKFEWAMGEANGQIPDETYVQGWQDLASRILKG